MPQAQKDAMEQLQSRQSQLLDTIDELRSIGAGGLVELPQIIVCGNQSSGKSSVLEAISRVRFPTKSDACTRFATEVILRRSFQSRIKVSIKPGPSKSNKEERKRLRSFTSEEFTNFDDLPQLIKEAQKHMGLSDSDPDSIEFSDDVLKVEISGPDKPDLTLVDLPGLYSSTSEEQTKEGMAIVRKLTEGYMQNKRSIILAVISAKMDFHLQAVLNIAQHFDEKYERVLGIITQPDTLQEGEEQEGNYLRILRNEKTHLQLGWHCLCNRSFKTKDSSDDERDERERKFFEKGSWSSVSRDLVGIDSLRKRLSKCLFNHICRNLPTLVADIESKILDREERIAKLGQERSSIQDQRSYLIDISSGFERITSQALSGMYDDAFFEGFGKSPSTDERFRRLRAITRMLHEYFYNAMITHGNRRQIVGFIGSSDHSSIPVDETNPYMNISEPMQISRASLEQELAREAQNCRGLELPGNSSHLLVGNLFRDQASPWVKIAHSHLMNCWDSVRYFVSQVLMHLTDEHTLFALTNTIIGLELEKIRDSLESKLEELTLNLKSGHPLPVGREFLSKINETRLSRHTDALESRLIISKGDAGRYSISDIRKATADLQSSTDLFAAGDIINQMQSYYDVSCLTHLFPHLIRTDSPKFQTALVVFVDNIVVLAVENCLLRPLRKIFTSKMVTGMSDDQIKEIAAEPQETRDERLQMTIDLKLLRGGKRALSIFSASGLEHNAPSLFGE